MISDPVRTKCSSCQEWLHSTTSSKLFPHVCTHMCLWFYTSSLLCPCLSPGSNTPVTLCIALCHISPFSAVGFQTIPDSDLATAYIITGYWVWARHLRGVTPALSLPLLQSLSLSPCVPGWPLRRLSLFLSFCPSPIFSTSKPFPLPISFPQNKPFYTRLVIWWDSSVGTPCVVL